VDHAVDHAVDRVVDRSYRWSSIGAKAQAQAGTLQVHAHTGRHTS
jgi:hypothetical protein